MCPTFRAHDIPIEKVNNEKYVGDIISHNGKHTSNITSRRSKGIGVVNEIVNILNSLCLGPHYFHVAMTLRQAMLISVLLFNAETWLRLNKSDITKLEKVDEMLLRKFLKVPTSTPRAALYLETGTIPISFLIKEKRIMFLHHILTRHEDALILKVFWVQVSQPAKGDWCTVVDEDMGHIGLQALSFQDVKQMHQGTLRSLVKKNVVETAFKHLLERKSSLSKLSSLHYDQLAMQQYLLDPDTTTRHKRLRFRWRTKMITVNWNYGQKTTCPLCKEHDDTQDHLLQCPSLQQVNSHTVGEEICIVELERAIRRREVMLEEKKKTKEHPEVYCTTILPSNIQNKQHTKQP